MGKCIILGSYVLVVTLSSTYTCILVLRPRGKYINKKIHCKTCFLVRTLEIKALKIPLIKGTSRKIMTSPKIINKIVCIFLKCLHRGNFYYQNVPVLAKLLLYVSMAACSSFMIGELLVTINSKLMWNMKVGVELELHFCYLRILYLSLTL